MNNKGQALVEFVIIMTIFIFTILAVFDLGNVVVQKYALENDIDTVVDMYEADKQTDIESYVSSIGAKVKYEQNGNYNKITLSKQVNIITPIVRQVLGKRYEINSKRTVIINEKIE